MPLRDHFRPPLSDRRSWEEVHGQWPAMVVQHLFPRLPPGYEAAPRVHLGAFCEIGIAAFDVVENGASQGVASEHSRGGVALAAPPAPSLTIETDLPELDEYEVRVYDGRHARKLVAAIEIVSPGNKDRPEHRQAFVSKCLALLQQGVSVSIIDLVTVRDFNLYVELLQQMNREDPDLGIDPSPLYAVTCRTRLQDKRGRMDTWRFSLALEERLPELPLILADDLVVMLDLDISYEQTCRLLHIA